jgi:predicted nucleic-acid-binding Zn-ribbon protein
MPAGCAKCGSERVAAAVPLDGSKGLLAQLRARVCADCGYTELFADNAMGVYLASRPATEAPVGPAANLQCPRCGSTIPAAASSCDLCGWTQETAR